MQVTLEDTKKASVLLIRKLFLLMQNLEALPNNVYITMKLYYYDDSKILSLPKQINKNLAVIPRIIGIISFCSFKVTPADYQPPGFKEGECDSLWFEGMAVHFKVGEVQTAFHTLLVRVSAEQGRLEKLQDGNHLRDSKKDSLRHPAESEAIEVGQEGGFLKCWN